ncbi:MAG: hypothetical protein V1839_00815 [archaeon]
MAFCFDCGKEISKDADLCPNCGKKFKTGLGAKIPFILAGLFCAFIIIAVVFTNPKITGLGTANCKTIQTEDVITYIEQEPYDDYEMVDVPLRYYVDEVGDLNIIWENFTYRKIVNARVRNTDEKEGYFTMTVIFDDNGTLTSFNRTQNIPAGKNRLYNFGYNLGDHEKNVTFSYKIESESIPVKQQVTKFRNVTKLMPLTINKTVC